MQNEETFDVASCISDSEYLPDILLLFGMVKIKDSGK